MKRAAQQERRRPQHQEQLDSVREQFALAVSMPLQSPSKDTDAMLFEAVGRASCDSGVGFGQRDHAWFFDTHAEREDALGKLQSLNSTRNLGMRFKSYSTRLV